MTGESCAIYSGYIYCVGGVVNFKNVYYAPVSSSGVGPWTDTANYPTMIQYQSCAIDSGYIYCVGGNTISGGISSAVYFATVSSSGVGAWTNTTSYPTKIEHQSCAINSGYIYCVGGYSGGVGYKSAVYFATVSSSGVGAWTNTTSYPTTIQWQSCATNSGYIYCVGGNNGPGPSSAVYFATVSSSGVGTWTGTTSYPTKIEYHSCATGSGFIYCVGGAYQSISDINAVYYAAVSSSGVGTWTSTTTYPVGMEYLSCATYSGHIYCVGGQSLESPPPTNVYYAGLTSTTTTTSTTSTTSTVTSSSSTTQSIPEFPSLGGAYLALIVIVVTVVVVSGYFLTRRSIMVHTK